MSGMRDEARASLLKKYELIDEEFKKRGVSAYLQPVPSRGRINQRFLKNTLHAVKVENVRNAARAEPGPAGSRSPPGRSPRQDGADDSQHTSPDVDADWEFDEEEHTKLCRVPPRGRGGVGLRALDTGPFQEAAPQSHPPSTAADAALRLQGRGAPAPPARRPQSLETPEAVRQLAAEYAAGGLPREVALAKAHLEHEEQERSKRRRHKDKGKHKGKGSDKHKVKGRSKDKTSKQRAAEEEGRRKRHRGASPPVKGVSV